MATKSNLLWPYVFVQTIQLLRAYGYNKVIYENNNRKISDKTHAKIEFRVMAYFMV